MLLFSSQNLAQKLFAKAAQNFDLFQQCPKLTPKSLSAVDAFVQLGHPNFNKSTSFLV